MTDQTKSRILLVDDEPHVLEGFERMLNDYRHVWDMIFVSNSMTAQDLITDEGFDIVVLDILMPGVNGLDILESLQKDARTSHAQIIVLTAIQDRSLKRQVLDLGATDLLNKPVLKEDLVARLTSAFRMKSYQDELRLANRSLRRELIQSQKVEVVGLLAAGVIHDLNNVLMSISLNSDMAISLFDEDSNVREHLADIKIASNQAKTLVRQFLEFSRQGQAPNRVIDLAAIITQSLGLLKSLVPPNVSIQWESPATPCLILANAIQICQVVINLCINGMQAMEDGGTLNISLSTLELNDGKRLFYGWLSEGMHMELIVRDSGVGMDSATMAHIFDPFFTTKKEGQGTGLGMMVIKYIVENHQGAIHVKSSPGEGSIFSIYLPCPTVAEQSINDEDQVHA